MVPLSAKEILQGYLDTIAQAVLSGDLATYLQGVSLPFRLVTKTARLQVLTEEELTEGFDTYGEFLADLGVTEMRRQVLEAEFETPDRIEGHYRTRILRGDEDAAAPFLSLIILDRVEGVWKSSAIRNTTASNRWPVILTGLPSRKP